MTPLSSAEILIAARLWNAESNSDDIADELGVDEPTVIQNLPAIRSVAKRLRQATDVQSRLLPGETGPGPEWSGPLFPG